MADDQTMAEVEDVVRSRLADARAEISHSLEQIAEGNPLGAEPDRNRFVNRLKAKAGFSREEAAIMYSAVQASARAAGAAQPPGPEAIQGTTLDFVGVAFLERGRRAANAVGRISYLSGRPQGTGFLVGPRLLLTNHHVISSAEEAGQFQVEFDYEYDTSNRLRPVTSFQFDPDYCFVTSGIEELDFTLIGLGARREGGKGLEAFGYLTLSDAGDKHMLGEIANLIQHPDGRRKELVLRENQLVSRDETQQVLHYIADTEQGSSGSPVFNNDWEPIALHHWGGPWREVMGISGATLATEVNEGIRISAIVKDLNSRPLQGSSAAVVRSTLEMWSRAPRQGAVEEAAAVATPAAGLFERPTGRTVPAARQNPDGSVTWTIPVEVNMPAPTIVGGAAERPKVAAPAVMVAEAASWKTEEFGDRGGYDPQFIDGFEVPLPGTKDYPWRLAENGLAPAGADPHVLPYHHFSVVMNAERRLCAFTAVNIDGAQIRAVIRDTKQVIDTPSLGELGIESIGAEGAEASDDFRPDRRILPGEQMNREFYEKQVVAGFPDPQSRARIARIFQKGHIVLRGDPAWGSVAEAVAAERDTFFYTNAAPQVGFFNQGSALNQPGSKGKLRWRAVETYVLRNAVTMGSRISVFAGPVFADDPEYRFNAKVPMRFWKLAVWSDGTQLRSIALLADQRKLIEVMPEAFTDEDELARVSEFLTTVAELEALTKLDFGKAVRNADVRKGESVAAALDAPAGLLNRPEKAKPQSARRRQPARRKTAKA